MAKTIEFEPVKLITGLIFGSQDAYTASMEQMEQKFGPIEFESEPFDFSYTDYYEPEMGKSLRRQFVSFETPVMPDRLSEIKQITNRMEQKYLNDTEGRLINIDPGLVSLANLILASTKNFSHRLYLGQGIFGEVTMLYENKTFVPLRWTYPDYQRADVIGFLLRVRDSLKESVIAFREKK